MSQFCPDANQFQHVYLLARLWSELLHSLTGYISPLVSDGEGGGSANSNIGQCDFAGSVIPPDDVYVQYLQVLMVLFLLLKLYHERDA